MTQEQELFTVLSSMILNKVYCRLEKDYGSKFKNSLFRAQGIQLLDSGRYMILLECMDDPNGRFITENILQVKPYLRSMSSMTEEEKEELRQEHIKDEKLFAECLKKAANGDSSMRGKVVPHFAADWCNKNHFDYRGLIPMGLAIEAPKEMYCN